MTVEQSARRPAVEIRILGPLEVLIDARRVDLGGPRPTVVLVSLALNANRIVSVGQLTQAIYGDTPPSTSRAQTQNTISSLRRIFAAHQCRDTIVTQAGGYLLQVAPHEIDLHAFEELLREARETRLAGQLPQAAARYRAALALWRGRALDDIDSQVIHATASQLNDRRITATEECIDLELDLGRHTDLTGELTGLIAEHPLRERLRGQLMIALYRSGRQVEALDVYRTARQTLVDELGIEPSEWLQWLERAILTSDPDLNLTAAATPAAATSTTGATATSIPAAGPIGAANLLPTDIADFTGRTRQITAIRQHLSDARQDATRLAVPVLVLVGKPGVGKTTLAVHIAHQEGGSYPDGQLFADLHGLAAQRVGPMQVLERFLRTLGVPGNAMPDDMEERAEMYRALLADRRMLVVLDNPGGEGHVLPLLPGGAKSAVIVTSQCRLTGLPGAIHVDVDVLAPQQSVELLSQILGAGRVHAESDTAAELARLCGHLPLALRIAGARLACRPHWSLSQLVERLENETRRLDEFRHAGMGIRASLSLAYEALGAEARRLLRRLALLEFPTFSGWVSAALLDLPIPEAQELLDELADTQLIETTSAGYGLPSQYRFHDLIRVFARERLVAEESTAERHTAAERVLGGMLSLLCEAHRRVYGGDYLHLRSSPTPWPLPKQLAQQLVALPLPWFERERAAIIAAVRQAAQAGLVDLCWQLAVTAVTLFEGSAYLNDWRETHEIALRAVRQANDTRGEAAMRYSTGSLHIFEQRFDCARRELDAAASLFRSIGDEHGEALVIRNLAYIDRIGGDPQAATCRYEQALEVFRRVDDLVAAAYVLHGLAQATLDANPDDGTGAKGLLSEALALTRQAGSRRVEAQVLHRLGDLHLRMGDPRAAIDVFAQALGTVQDIGDPVGQAYVLYGVGVSHLHTGELDKAGMALRDARELARSANERLVYTRTCLALGEVALAQDLPAVAVDELHQALELLHEVRAPALETKVKALLSEATSMLVGPDEEHPSPAS